MVSELPCLGSRSLRFGSRKKIPTLTVPDPQKKITERKGEKKGLTGRALG
jgi:hypothetical protein